MLDARRARAFVQRLEELFGSSRCAASTSFQARVARFRLQPQELIGSAGVASLEHSR